ncbi:MAG: ABC transporter permease [Opitutae bacterium]|nr:ABC transporter permease [Opitutae bacterium]
MSPKFRIALRFLTAKKRAMLMSLACIVLGVGMFIVTQATTSGFEGLFIKTILGTDGAIRIEDKIQETHRSMAAGGHGTLFETQLKEGRKYIEGIEEPKQVIEGLRQIGNVTAWSEVLRGAAMVHSAFKSESARIYGVDIVQHQRVSDIGQQIVQGSMADFRDSPNSVLVGRVMAERLQLSVNDSIQLEAKDQMRRYRVAAIYETGVKEIDRERVYMNIAEARSLLKKRTGSSYLQIALLDADRAREDAARMVDVLHHSAAGWQDREKTWLSVFRALRISSGITVSIFTLIAGLAMFNTLAMIVMEKTKEIAILRSMGYTREDISGIFLWQAGIVLVVGSVLGCLLGALVTYYVGQIRIEVKGIFKTDTFVVAWSIWHYVEATLTAVVMVMVASLLPARRAARLEPGDVIRGTGQ